MDVKGQWIIRITDGDRQIGDDIPVTFWDVLSKLADCKAAYNPIGWDAEAYFATVIVKEEATQ
jgi:hypothetical protein